MPASRCAPSVGAIRGLEATRQTLRWKSCKKHSGRQKGYGASDDELPAKRLRGPRTWGRLTFQREAGAGGQESKADTQTVGDKSNDEG